MSLLDRINIQYRAVKVGAEERTLSSAPWAPWLSPLTFGRSSFPIGGPAHPSEAMSDNEVVGLTAVYGAISHISNMVASLPIRTYRRLADGSSQRMTSSMLLGDEVSGNGPQLAGTLFSWLSDATACALLHGSCFGLITNRSGIPGQDGLGLPTKVAWLDPTRVYVQNDEQRPEDPRLATVFYNGRQVAQENLMHLKAISMPGHLEGISPLRQHALTMATGRAQASFARSWFEGGGFPLGAFAHETDEVTDEQSTEIRRRLTDALRTHQPLVYGKDWSYTPFAVPADEAQFVTAQQYTASQIATIFQVPPWRVGGTRGDSMTYSSVVSDQLDELQNTLNPWLVRWEHLLTSLLPKSQYAKFDTDAFLKTDPATRATISTAQRNIGTRTVNEIRAADDLAPVRGGDDVIPGSAQEAMFRSTKAIPTAYLPLVTLEMELAADKLKEIREADQGAFANPALPPVPQTAEQYVGAQVRGYAAQVELRRIRDNWTEVPDDGE